MDPLLEVNIKNEPTDSTLSEQMEIPTERQIKLVQQESDCLAQSEIYIKTEPQENESEFLVTAGSSYEMCSNYDVKLEIEEPLIKIKCEVLENEMMQDPLDVGDKIKVEEHFSIDFDFKSEIKTEPTEREKCEHLLEADKDSYSHDNKLNQGQLVIRNDQGRKIKQYFCIECKKIFKQKCQLDNHLRIHTGKKPFTCEICKKAFTQKGHLDGHMLIHSGEKPHICDICEKAFNRKSNLDKHKLIHSGKKPFACNDCGKSFARKQDLIIHERKHTGVKPYACNMCDKAFIQKGDLTKHIRTHTGEKPFSCDTCKKSFADKSALKKHKKIHTNE